MKKTIIAAAALVAMTACNKTLIETPMIDSNYGYINLGINADTEMVVTKTMEAVDDPSNFNISILDSDNSSVYAGKYSAIPEDGLKVEAGTYTVKAENITEAEAETSNSNFGQLRVSGTNSTVVVNAGEPTTARVECDIQNTKVMIAYEKSFTDLFKGSYSTQLTEDASDSETIADDVRTLEMSPNSEAFFNVNENGKVSLKWVLTAKTSESAAAKTFYNVFESEKAKCTKLSFAASGAQGSIIVNIWQDTELKETVTMAYVIDPITGDITLNNAQN